MRVIAALDTGLIAERTLAAVAPWVRSSGAELIILTVLHPDRVHATVSGGSGYSLPTEFTTGGRSPDIHDPLPRVVEDHGRALERAHEDFERYLRELTSRHLSGVPVDFRVELSEHTARAILNYAKQVRAELLVLGTHAHRRAAQLVFGSVAQTVVRESHVPVLLVGPSVDGPDSFDTTSASRP